MSDNDILLRVENLCQYFKSGNSELKAVDDVSFELKKGEVLGLVGESGCGKTTVGRTIIKLYDATSGCVWLKNQRISAGTRATREMIAAAKRDLREKIRQLNISQKKELNLLLSGGQTEQPYKETEQDESGGQNKEREQANKENVQANENEQKREQEKIYAKYAEMMMREKAACAEFVSSKQREIREMNDDQRHCDRKFSLRMQRQVDDEYLPQIKQAEADLEKCAEGAEKEQKRQALKKLRKSYKEKMHIAKKEKIVTQIQMVFQDPTASLNPRMTVREIIAEGLIIKGIKDKQMIDKKVFEVLEMVGLQPEHASRYPHEFSGGQRQRIGIARVIILNPALIIADEPVSALDVSIQAQVINLLDDLRKKLGLTILFIAHDLSVIKYFSDRIAVMYFGKIVEIASGEQLFAHPMHPYTKSLLSAIPLPDPVSEKSRVRIAYNPLAKHDYSASKPRMREISNDHFVYCNDEEFEAYKSEYNS